MKWEYLGFAGVEKEESDICFEFSIRIFKRKWDVALWI